MAIPAAAFQGATLQGIQGGAGMGGMALQAAALQGAGMAIPAANNTAAFAAAAG